MLFCIKQPKQGEIVGLPSPAFPGREAERSQAAKAEVREELRYSRPHWGSEKVCPGMRDTAGG